MVANRGYNYGISNSIRLDAAEYILEAVYNANPEKFTKFVKNEEISKGYYIDNPTAKPGVTREEPYDEAPSKMNKYTVTHYGDFAIEEAVTWYYSKGRLEWENGVFYDEKAGYSTETKGTLYYKGEYVTLLFGDEGDILVADFGDYICEFGYTKDGYLHYNGRIK